VPPPKRGDEVVVGGKDRQVHLPVDGLSLLLHLDVVVGGAARRDAERRGAHRRPPDQLLLLLLAAVIEERQCLLERSLAAPADSLKLGSNKMHGINPSLITNLRLKLRRRLFGIARSNNFSSATVQVLICLFDASSLNGQDVSPLEFWISTAHRPDASLDHLFS
jgi:hypothetical protein